MHLVKTRALAVLTAALAAASSHAQPTAIDLETLAIPSSTTRTFPGFPTSDTVYWYRFVVPAIAAPSYLDIGTAGDTLGVDTDIALFRADGTVVADNDDGGRGVYSALSFGAACQSRPLPAAAPTSAADLSFAGRNGPTLAAGEYYLAVAPFDATFTAGFNVAVQNFTADANPARVQINLGVAGPFTLPANIIQLGTLAAGTPAVATFTLFSGAVNWVQFTVPQNVAAPTSFLDIKTDGPFDVDTLAVLYRADGAIVPDNVLGGIGLNGIGDDQSGPGNFSAFSFGAICGSRPNLHQNGTLSPGITFAGRDGPTLAAGTYLLAVTGRPSGTPAVDNCFVFAPNHTRSGSLTVTVNYGVPPAPTPPPSLALGAVPLGSEVAGTQALAAGGTRFYSFTLPTAVSAPGTFLDIVVDGPTFLDSVIALYNSQGIAVGADDDSGFTDTQGAAGFSALSFGGSCGSRTAVSNFGWSSNFPLIGFNTPQLPGGVLAPGTYYVAVTGFTGGLTFRPCFEVFAPGVHGSIGDVEVRVRHGVTPPIVPPANVNLGALVAGAPVAAPFTIAPNEVVWFGFTLGASLTPPSYFDIRLDAPFPAGDTEIALYRADGSRVSVDDNAGPELLSSLSYGNGACPRTNASTGGLAAGELLTGQDGATLAAGQYFLAVTGAVGSQFEACFGASVRGGNASLSGTVTLDLGALPPEATPPAGAQDLGVISAGAPVQATVNLDGGAVAWLRFTLGQPVAAPASFLDVLADGFGSTDTEIALYSAAGLVLAEDDDDGPGLFSAVSFGGSCGARNAASAFGQVPGFPLAGGDGDGLPAGEYYLAVTGFDAGATFGSCFTVAAGHQEFGAVTVTVATGATPPGALPAVTELGAIAPGAALQQAFTLAPGEVRYFRFTVGAVNVPDFLDLWTDGDSGLADVLVLFEGDGEFLEANAASGPGAFSALSFGSGCPGRPIPSAFPGVLPGSDRFGQDGTLAAGTYVLAVTGAPIAIGAECFAISQNHTQSGAATLNIRRGVSGPATAPPAIDLGVVGAGNQGPLVSGAVLESGQVLWFRFTLQGPADEALAPGSFLDIDTRDALLDPVNNTALVLFDAAGNIEAGDDDDGPDLLSQLSFGSAAPREPLPGGVAPAGQDGALPAGEYYLAVAASPSLTLLTCPWSVLADGVAGGAVTVHFTTNIPGGGSAGCNVADIVSIGGFPPADGELTVDDYTSFINAFAGDELLADIVAIGGFPPADGELTVDDYTSFINAFAEGC